MPLCWLHRAALFDPSSVFVSSGLGNSINWLPLSFLPESLIKLTIVREEYNGSWATLLLGQPKGHNKRGPAQCLRGDPYQNIGPIISWR